jgi:hypothetical protein
MLIEKILAEFPAAKDLAYQRIFAGHSIFFNARTHRLLPQFSEALVFAALILAHVFAREIGEELNFTVYEKRIWDSHFGSCQ